MRLRELESLPCFALLGPGFAGEWLLLSDPTPTTSDPTVVLAPFEAAPEDWLRLGGTLQAVHIELDGVYPPLDLAFDTTGYIDRVESIREAIAAGDVYQVCYTLRAEVASARGSELAAAMWGVETPPFAAWVRLRGGVELVSASPELLLATSGGHVRTEPMKGTGEAGTGGALAGSAKDAAELAMITDLLRNDLTPVCEPRSVRVGDPRRLVALPYAVQTVSVVEGTLAPGVTPLAALAAVHPGGSVTGAPKQAALRMIRELEPTPRGLYCGALGLFQHDRSVTSLLIRTAFRKGEDWVYGVGSGIVYDSVPEHELAELHVKLGALGIARPNLHP